MKYIGSLSSILIGVLTFICLSLACVGDNAILNFSFTGWELIKSSSEATGVILFKIFAIICLIFAIILIFYGILLLLIDLKVIKIKSKLNLNILNNLLITIFVISALIMFIGGFIVIDDYNYLKGYVGVGPWLLLIASAVLCLFCWIFARKQSK